MNKSQLVAKIADSTELAKADVEKVVDALVVCVKETLAEGDKVQLVGFGTFEAKAREARTGVNPLTGEKIDIAACKVPSFKAGKAFKEELNK